MSKRAFVSHSTADDSYVAEIESFLRHTAGFEKVFNDVRSIDPDEEFWPKIQEGISKCDALIVIITAASITSAWVIREVQFARSLSKKIIPLWVEDCPLPPIFQNRDVIDLRRRAPELVRTDISRIFKYAPADLIGREAEKKLISDIWAKVLRAENGRPNVLTFVALGGEGKTSLIAKWVVDEMSAKGCPGCDAAFAWSFYSQGTDQKMAASSDLFLKEALTFFGDDADKEFAAGSASAFEKGQRLARIVGQRRCLLILDGLEPLQYSPASPTPGELKDHGICSLLRGFATNSRALCIVTTRHSVPDLKAFWRTTAPEVPLLRLSRESGVHLLKTIGVKGAEQEFETLVEGVKGHALTLTLLGGFLKRAFRGDIRQRDRVKFEKADEKMDGGHAFRTMVAYEQWLLSDGGDEGRREVAVLRLMGLFDRPADASCLAALRNETIPGLTEPLSGLANDDWEFCLSGLEAAKLLTVNRDVFGTLVSLDAHPHLREYFAQQMRTQQPDAWRAANQRIYEHLCMTTTEGEEPLLEDFQPLYQAVSHGCQAGLHAEVMKTVFLERIFRGDEYYSFRKLGSIGSDLGAMACFFELPWSRVCASISAPDQALLLHDSAFLLRALGRLNEAIEPFQAGLKYYLEQQDWVSAAITASNLSELQLMLGDVTSALVSAEAAGSHAESSGRARQVTLCRTTHADVLHQAGKFKEAESLFVEAEKMQAQKQPDYPLLYSLWGFRYYDLIVAKSEQAAWREVLGISGDRRQACRRANEDACSEVVSRSDQIFEWRNSPNWNPNYDSILNKSFNHFASARARLYRAINRAVNLCPEQFVTADDFVIMADSLEKTVDGFRRARHLSYLLQSLLTRSWLRFLVSTRTGPDSAQADLDEAWEIAERGPMRLFMADIHLYRARLFFREEKYPEHWGSPEQDLKAARKLIEDCGYGRRMEELQDAEAAILEKH